MGKIFVSYQIQFKQHRKDKNWNAWCTISDLEKAREMVTKIQQTHCPTRLMELRTEVKILEERY